MSAYLEAFAHATESLAKVVEAVKNLLPEGLRGKVEPSVELVRGHYDNEIAIVRLELRGEDVDLFMRELSARMSEDDKRELKLSLDLRVDGSSIYLRLDKGQAYLGRVKLASRGDSIKVRLTPSLPKGASLKEYLRRAGLLSP